SGAHMTLVPKIVEEMRARGLADVVVFAGGIIPEDDVAALRDLGVAEIFTPGAPLDGIGTWLESSLDSRETAASA
ncbi:MAG TPA: methylmalonyl-CoA mutase, partial [Acidimicrobiia bacterium]|nr:methylmalonyl-CoA mutase [Acidimicrobiia bacterium]